MKFLTDAGLKQINAKKFREQTGVTKTDYRFLRNLILGGLQLGNISCWIPNEASEKELTLHEFCQKLRGIDVIYITRMQKERHVTEKLEEVLNE